MEKICEECTKKFHIRPSRVKIGHGKFCSKECHYNFVRGKSISDERKNRLVLKSTQIKKSCLTCKKDFKVRKCRYKKAKYCSVKCRSVQQKYQIFTEQRKKDISDRFKGKKKSKEHIEKVKKFWREHPRFGKNAPGWKGGITKLNILIRNVIQMNKWREAVFKRDNYTCIWCGARSGNGKTVILNADHIKPLAYLIKLYAIKNIEEALNCKKLWEVKNGRTLCLGCHKKTDTYKAKSNLYGKNISNRNDSK